MKKFKAQRNNIPFVVSSIVSHIGAEVQSVGSDMGAIGFDCGITYFPYAEEIYCNIDKLDHREYFILFGICAVNDIKFIEVDHD